MRADDAKRLPLDQILAQPGHMSVKSVKGRRELSYISPFRREERSSLHISYLHHARLGGIWVWKDFSDSGSNIAKPVRASYRQLMLVVMKRYRSSF